MQDFNDFNNDSNNADNAEPKSSLSGFDSVANQNNTDFNTESDGFYTKQKNDIIQDDAFAPQPQSRSYFDNANTQSSSFGDSGSYDGFTNPHTYSAPKSENKKKKYGGGVVALACILAAVIGALSGGAVSYISLKNSAANTKTSNLPNNNVNINVNETADSVVEAVAQKVAPCVVGIRTTTSVTSFFGGTSESSGEGSGVIVSPEGYIVTNYHVISDAASNKTASKIEVFLDKVSSDSYEATTVGYNISADIAVIKINATGLPAIEMADSSKLKVGQYVITVGNPGGLEFMDSVTYGVISGLNRVVSSNSGIELIQTDAAINPGNSGGALVNTKGELVGINSSKIVSEEFEGMGFAIPSNTVSEICNNIISKENSPEPYVGISISEKYTPEVLKFYGYPVGAVVGSVVSGSPADNAGLERGDIITAFGDTEINNYTLLEDAIKNCSPGDNVTVKLYRNGKYYSAKITVGSNNAVN